MNSYQVLLLDSSFAIQNGGESVLKRHAEYAAELEYKSQGCLELILLCTFSNAKVLGEFDKDPLRLVPLKANNRATYFFHSLRYISKNRSEIRLIIAGDVWISGLNAIFSSFSFRNRIPIQFQVHADIGAPSWKFFNYRHFVKFYVGVSTLKFARFVRVVSKTQRLNLIKYLNKKTEVVTVPIYTEVRATVDKKVHRKVNGKVAIGFLGRIESDRGLENLLILLDKIKSNLVDYKLIIAGSGRDEDWLKSELTKFSEDFEFVFCGHLQGAELDHFFEEIDILFSLAPFESYGRVARESIALGVPVLATRSSGMTDLFEDSPPNSLTIIDLEIASGTLMEILKRAKILREQGFASNMESTSAIGQLSIADTWVNYINANSSSKATKDA
jgi:glycosyltransferase involved in cell wall biosynthesis